MTAQTRWPTVRLGEVLAPVSREESVDPAKVYPLLGVRLDGRGPFLRETVSGAETAAKRFSRVASGDFIYSRLFAWRGAFGVISEELDGAYVSDEFPTFAASPDRLDSEFLRYWFQLPSMLERVTADCTGSTPLTRNRFKERFFLSLEIPLPPLAEQQRIVSRIEELAALIDEARTLGRQAAADTEVLCRSILASDADSRLTPMSELVRLRTPDVSVEPQQPYKFAGVYSFGRGVFPAGTKIGTEFSYPRLTRLRTGDFVYPKLMAWEGAFGVVPPECDGCVVSPEFPVFEVDETRVLRDVLDTHFRTPGVWPAIAGASTGTNVRRRRLNPRDFLAYRLPLPSESTQLTLRQVRAQVGILARLHRESSEELNAILPAILDRALKGKL